VKLVNLQPLTMSSVTQHVTSSSELHDFR